jgi:hypothetical protein
MVMFKNLMLISPSVNSSDPLFSASAWEKVEQAASLFRLSLFQSWNKLTALSTVS